MCQEHNFLNTDYSTRVCTFCGLEQAAPLQPRYYDIGDKAPLYISAYSRHKRFYNFLMSVVDPIFATHPPQKTIYLLMQDKQFESLDELLSELKRKKTHQKSYCHLHYYARRFWTGYEEPAKLSKVQVNNVMSFFGKVEATFERAGLTCSFFSYPWLCRKLLLLFGFERFTPFVKTIICKKRIKKYESLWNELGLNVVLEQFRVRFNRLHDALTNCRLVASDRAIAPYSLLEQLKNSTL